MPSPMANCLLKLAPCGRCCEFMRQFHSENLATDVILDLHQVVKLAKLLPYHGWFHKIPDMAESARYSIIHWH
jgi:cytidine deaminase